MSDETSLNAIETELVRDLDRALSQVTWTPRVSTRLATAMAKYVDRRFQKRRERGEAPRPSAPVSSRAGGEAKSCIGSRINARVCERGTRGCEVMHVRTIATTTTREEDEGHGANTVAVGQGSDVGVTAEPGDSVGPAPVHGVGVLGLAPSAPSRVLPDVLYAAAMGDGHVHPQWVWTDRKEAERYIAGTSALTLITLTPAAPAAARIADLEREVTVMRLEAHGTGMSMAVQTGALAGWRERAESAERARDGEREDHNRVLADWAEKIAVADCALTGPTTTSNEVIIWIPTLKHSDVFHLGLATTSEGTCQQRCGPDAVPRAWVTRQSRDDVEAKLERLQSQVETLTAEIRGVRESYQREAAAWDESSRVLNTRRAELTKELEGAQRALAASLKREDEVESALAIDSDAFRACAHACGIEHVAEGHGPQPGSADDVVRAIEEGARAIGALADAQAQIDRLEAGGHVLGQNVHYWKAQRDDELAKKRDLSKTVDDLHAENKSLSDRGNRLAGDAQVLETSLADARAMCDRLTSERDEHERREVAVGRERDEARRHLSEAARTMRSAASVAGVIVAISASSRTNKGYLGESVRIDAVQRAFDVLRSAIASISEGGAHGEARR